MAMKVVHLFVFLLAISTALALTCYKCDSSSGVNCNYGLLSFTYETENCNSDSGAGSLLNWVPKQCVKLVAKTKEGGEHVARGCMPHLGGACTAVAKTLGFFGSIDGNIEDINCYPCDGDKCNSASKFAGYSFVGILLAALAFLF